MSKMTSSKDWKLNIADYTKVLAYLLVDVPCNITILWSKLEEMQVKKNCKNKIIGYKKIHVCDFLTFKIKKKIKKYKKEHFFIQC
jgi:hypothetical protein